MDITNKIITISYMSVTTFPEETVVKVVVSKEILPGVFKTLDTYDLNFDKLYQNTSDPALLVAINEKLAEIPE